MRVALAILLLATTAHAGDVRFGELTVIENRDAGSKVSLTRATNESDRPRSVTVDSGGVRYQLGTLQPGESASVRVIEQRGGPPTLILDRE